MTCVYKHQAFNQDKSFGHAQTCLIFLQIAAGEEAARPRLVHTLFLSFKVSSKKGVSATGQRCFHPAVFSACRKKNGGVEIILPQLGRHGHKRLSE